MREIKKLVEVPVPHKLRLKIFPVDFATLGEGRAFCRGYVKTWITLSATAIFAGWQEHSHFSEGPKM